LKYSPGIFLGNTEQKYENRQSG